ncbi:hypothetical protein [Anthocerotibacter panamensis]|uniref:hypothetical protein n=1 Tax=Anthocerotibacter panamensis TaxID=2857077 RepID=UPI001C4048DB|nr:hypothetical protein [Anthocerotibacter panamensis]
MKSRLLFESKIPFPLAMNPLKSFLLSNGATPVKASNLDILRHTYGCPDPTKEEWYRDDLAGGFQCVGCWKMCMSRNAEDFAG